MRVPIVLMAALCVFITYSYGQTTEHGFKIIDKLTQEPISGATVKTSKNVTHKTNELGKCTIITVDIDTLTITCAGFKSRVFPVNTGSQVIELEQDVQKLKEIVVTAGRTSQSRREAPVAISTVNTQMLQDTKPISLDQVLNKTSGVFMVNLGNEQHQMSIRQPMSTKSLYLYLEDGIPVRTTGLYNHNALLEMNMVSAKQIEVIRGPASSMYGAEAIGGAINVITLTPPALS
ncbi:MAG TPA: TonB-dependent receptor plug domain-containing protein, partial [Sphingobacteriaceae bacterium]